MGEVAVSVFRSNLAFFLNFFPFVFFSSFSIRLSYKFLVLFASFLILCSSRQKGLFPERESSETYIGRQSRRVADAQRVSWGKRSIALLCVVPTTSIKAKSDAERKLSHFTRLFRFISFVRCLGVLGERICWGDFTWCWESHLIVANGTLNPIQFSSISFTILLNLNKLHY